MPIKDLLIKIGIKGDKKAQGALKKTEGSMKSLGSAAMKVGGVFFAAKGLISGFSSVIRLAGEQEQAEKKLEVALGKTSKALLDHASALQKMTAFGDEAIIGVQASLAAFIKDEEQIKKATEATLDMAVAMGMDLKAAGDLVAKTLGSSTNAMSRYGIQVEGAVGSTERLESLTNNVATLFGGQASAQAETMTGKIEQMKNSMGDAAETLGEVFSPAIIGSANLIKESAENLKDFIAVSGDTIMSLFGIEKKTEESAIATKDFSSEQKRLADELKATNAQLLEQKSISEDLRTFYTSRAEGLSQEINALKLRKMELDGTTEAMIEVVKMGGEVTANEMEQINTLIQLRQEVKNLSEGRENADQIAAASFEAFELAQFDKLLAMEHEKDLIEKFIVKNEEMALKLGLVKIKTDEAGYSWDTFNANLDTAIASSIATASSISSVTDALGASKQAAKQAAVSFVSGEIQKAVAGYIRKFLMTTPLPPIISGPLAIAGGAAFGSLMSSTIARNFAQGGIVPGKGDQDTVPAMLTPGEVILNQAQQENLAGGMGGITLNISAPLVDESIIDTILPAIQKAQRMNLA
jgi:hypothetical protein|tara:strand:- start:3722 stop:5464 length:1743 start_codon:yes stop_codon:yes gene_type:complete